MHIIRNIASRVLINVTPEVAAKMHAQRRVLAQEDRERMTRQFKVTQDDNKATLAAGAGLLNGFREPAPVVEVKPVKRRAQAHGPLNLDQ